MSRGQKALDPRYLSDLVVKTEPEAAASLAATRARANATFENLLTQNTRDNYERLWKGFARWCLEHRREPLPADHGMVIDYLQTRIDAGRAAGSLQVIVSAINFKHLEASLLLPEGRPISLFLRSARREIGRPTVKKAAAVADVTKRMADACDGEPEGLHDRALLLVNFAGGFRRGELSKCLWEHVEIDDRELRILIPKSKTDQEGRGRTTRIALQPGSPYCPGAALRAWSACLAKLEGGAASGLVFRSMKPRSFLRPLRGAALAQIVKYRAAAVGLDSTKFSGHSMRRGMVTESKRRGIPDEEIMAKTGHKSAHMLKEYTEASGRLSEGLL